MKKMRLEVRMKKISLEVVAVALVIATWQKFYVHLLNFKLSSLVFLKTYNTVFDNITITFAD